MNSLERTAAALDDLLGLTTCHCDAAWTDRGLHAPDCHSDARGSVLTLVGAFLTRHDAGNARCDTAAADPPPLTAYQLAQQLMRHPEAVVQLALPRETYVLDGAMYLGNDDGSLDETPARNGVVMLTVSIGDYLR